VYRTAAGCNSQRDIAPALLTDPPNGLPMAPVPHCQMSGTSSARGGTGLGAHLQANGVVDSAESISRDVRAVSRIEAVPMLLRVIAETTGMGFAAVARVTEGTWTACAVHDRIAFNLKPGGQLDVSTTLCNEVRQTNTPIVIEHASQHPVYCNHATPKLYSIESYVSVPIVLPDGQYFGNLCAIDAKPAKLSEPGILAMFTSFAKVIALQLDMERVRQVDAAALLDERASGELREQFIAVLGHDLRNPLASVSAIGHVLKRQPDKPEQVRALAERIDRSCRRMSELIDATLDLAQARLGGGIRVVPVDVAHVGDLLNSVVSELLDARPGRIIRADLDVNRSVVCDPGRLQQLVSNLLANALTHGSQTEPVSLVARITGDYLDMEVANQGEPIPPEALPQLFAPFQRSSISPTREGLGLGLYICSQIVKAHAGTIEVTSTREAGTRFAVKLAVAN
jgi:signal transduction histidine kinase